jgi:ACS family hexuronate transporter-like MFS transporter
MWVPSGVLMLSSLLSYVDRQVLAVLSPTILHDTGLSSAAYTDALSAFSIAYMVANPLWGSVLDFVGLRAGMLMAVAIWTVASVSHAWVAGFVGFALARAVLGFGEGATFPGGLKTAMEALPPDRQARGMAIGYSGASLGAIVTPLIVTPIALHYGWQMAFLVTGVMGVVWLGLWWKAARPPFLPEPVRTKLVFRLPNLMERRFWLVVASFGLGAVALGVISSLSPLYLNRAMGLSQAELGRILWIPMVGWEAGYFFWGWVADRYVGSDEARTVRVFLLLTALALPSALITRTNSWVVAVAFFFWAMFIADGFVVMSLRVGARLYPLSQAGLVAGIGSGSWAAVQAIVLPVYGRWFSHQQYEAIFVSMSLLPVVGTGLWMWLNRNVPSIALKAPAN